MDPHHLFIPSKGVRFPRHAHVAPPGQVCPQRMAIVDHPVTARFVPVDKECTSTALRLLDLTKATATTAAHAFQWCKALGPTLDGVVLSWTSGALTPPATPDLLLLPAGSEVTCECPPGPVTLTHATTLYVTLCDRRAALGPKLAPGSAAEAIFLTPAMRACLARHRALFTAGMFAYVKGTITLSGADLGAQGPGFFTPSPLLLTNMNQAVCVRDIPVLGVTRLVDLRAAKYTADSTYLLTALGDAWTHGCDGLVVQIPVRDVDTTQPDLVYSGPCGWATKPRRQFEWVPMPADVPYLAGAAHKMPRGFRFRLQNDPAGPASSALVDVVLLVCEKRVRLRDEMIPARGPDGGIVYENGEVWAQAELLTAYHSTVIVLQDNRADLEFEPPMETTLHWAADFLLRLGLRGPLQKDLQVYARRELFVDTCPLKDESAILSKTKSGFLVGCVNLGVATDVRAAVRTVLAKVQDMSGGSEQCVLGGHVPKDAHGPLTEAGFRELAMSEGGMSLWGRGMPRAAVTEPAKYPGQVVMRVPMAL